MKTMDIDICVVSETHLKPDVPDAIVNIPNYTIHRNWDRNYKRKIYKKTTTRDIVC